MLVEVNGQTWCFAEEMIRMKHKGRISVAKLNEDGFGTFRSVIESCSHLSYPMIFQKDGIFYMIPESSSTRSVDLYICLDFPYKWAKKCTLFSDVLFVDSNVFEYNNHWYFVTGEMDPQIGSKTRLLLFDADNIENEELIPFSMNSFSNYSYSSRGGGAIFKNKDGSIFFPTQYGDESHYGKGVILNCIEISHEEEKNECTKIDELNVDTIKIDKEISLLGVHTYAFTDKYEVVDIQYVIPTNIILFMAQCFRRLRNVIK